MSLLLVVLSLFVLRPARSGKAFVARLLNLYPQTLQTNVVSGFLPLHELTQKSRQKCKAGLAYPKKYRALMASFWRKKSQHLVLELFEQLAKSAGNLNPKFLGDKHPHHGNCSDFMYELSPIHIKLDHKRVMGRWRKVFSPEDKQKCQVGCGSSLGKGAYR